MTTEHAYDWFTSRPIGHLFEASNRATLTSIRTITEAQFPPWLEPNTPPPRDYHAEAVKELDDFIERRYTPNPSGGDSQS